jgi:tetratricopeptide (TPR) repeat protein
LPLWTRVADRFLLVPSVGAALVVAGLTSGGPPARRALGLGLGALCALLYGAGLYVERARFGDDLRLWTYGVAVVPQSSISRHNLGIHLLRRGEVDRAARELERAHALGRRHRTLYIHLAAALEGTGRYEEAERAARIAVERNPDASIARAQLAALLRRRGDLAGAERLIEEAAMLAPPDAILLRQKGALQIARGQAQEALVTYRRITELEPQDHGAWAARGRLALSGGDLDEARRCAARCSNHPSCLALRAALSTR